MSHGLQQYDSLDIHYLAFYSHWFYGLALKRASCLVVKKICNLLRFHTIFPVADFYPSDFYAGTKLSVEALLSNRFSRRNITMIHSKTVIPVFLCASL